MTFDKSKKPADADTSNRLQKPAHFGNWRCVLATTYCSRPQASRLDSDPVLLGFVALRVLDRIGETRQVRT